MKHVLETFQTMGEISRSHNNRKQKEIKMKTNYQWVLALKGINRILIGLFLAAGVMLTQPVMAEGPVPVDPGSAVTTTDGDTIDTVDNTGSSGSGMDLVIKANGSNNDISINSGANLSISVQLILGDHSRAYVDWWLIARVNSSWYYLNSSMQWTPFDINLSNCHPVYQGYLFNLPETKVLDITGLPVGVYTFWFAVDQMDWIWVDSVNVTVQ